MAVRVEPFDDLDAAAVDAGGALGRTTQASLHDRLSWLRLAAAHLPGSRPLVLRAVDGDDRGWLFLDMAGRDATAPGRWYTLRYAPVFAGSPAPTIRHRLLTALAAAARHHAARLTLTPLHPRPLAVLAAAFAEAGWRTRSGVTSANWSVPVAGRSFADYWAERPSRLRSTVARKRRTAGLSVVIGTRYDPAAWAAFIQVFAASWKPAEGSPGFLRALAEQEGRAGTLRLGLASLGDEPVAAQLWLIENGVATIHKLAHARTHDTLSPGSLLMAAMMEAVIDGDRPSLIDFGTGDDAYKADWMTSQTPLHTLEAADPRQPRGLARVLRWRAAALVGRRRLD